MRRKIHIVYFSGTGGTAYAAESLRNKCEEEGVEVKLHALRHEEQFNLTLDEIMVLMYPVYACDAPKSVYKFLKGLPRGKHEVVIIPVSGGGYVSPNTACSFHVKKKLQKKGYHVLSEYHLVMPSNFIIPTEEKYAVELIQILPEKCTVIVKEILEHIPRQKKPLRRDQIMRALCTIEKQGAKVFGRTLKVMDSCTSCGLCEMKCPSTNIKIVEGKPNFGWACDLCMGCVYACPVKAIQPRIMKSFVLKDGYHLRDIVNKAHETKPDFIPPKENKKLWEGVMNYIYHDEI